MGNTIIIGKADKHICEFLTDLQYNVIVAEDNCKLAGNFRNHIDLSLLKLDDNTFVCEESQTEIINLLKNSGNTVYTVKMPEYAEYPADCTLNFAITGNTVIGSKKALTDELNQIFIKHGFKFVDVKQGYAKCSTIILGDNSIITDDESVYKVVLNNGFDVLKVSKGDVSLSGYDYGFIGGASFVDEERKIVVFFGDVSTHKNYKEITGFIKNQGYEIKSISDYPLTDIGGAVII